MSFVPEFVRKLGRSVRSSELNTNDSHPAWRGLKVATLISLCVLAAWWATASLFGVWTEHGAVYDRALTPDSTPPASELVEIRPNQEYFTRYVDPATGLTEMDVFLGGRIALTLYLGRTAVVGTVPRLNRSGPLCHTATESYSLAWRLSGSAGPTARRLFGDTAVAGCALLVGFTASPAWAPNARDVEIQVPRGGLEPLVALLLQRAARGNGDGPEVEILTLVAKRLAAETAERLRYDAMEQELETIAFLYGPVQFLTVTMTFFCAFALFLSLFVQWARDVAENAMNLIPYIGFFGTLLGMGAALAILGEANLSDPVSKAVHLGPIGSKLALAIETTKLALVCFGLTTLVSMVRDALSAKLRT